MKMKYAYDNNGQEIARALLLIDLLGELRLIFEESLRTNAENEFGVDTDDGFIKIGTIEDERI